MGPERGHLKFRRTPVLTILRDRRHPLHADCLKALEALITTWNMPIEPLENVGKL